MSEDNISGSAFRLSGSSTQNESTLYERARQSGIGGGQTPAPQDVEHASGSGESSWLVAPKEQSTLTTLLQRFNEDPDTEIERLVGPSDNPSVIVVQMTESTAEGYQQAFQDVCHIERNAPLELLGDTHE